MKIKYLFPFFLLFSILLNGQQNQFCGQIDYTFNKNIALPYSANYRMIFNSDFSYCEENNIQKSTNQIDKEVSDLGITTNHIVGRKNLTPNFYYNNGKDFYFREIFMDEELVVKEDSLKMNWKLETETKEIAHFSCRKATVNFRGRNYTAWYTSDISVPYGPWKFFGLPGLILEVYDTENVFYIAATNIVINPTPCEPIHVEKEFEKAISIESYIEKQEIIIDNFFNRLSAKLPKGMEPLKMDKDCEDCGKDVELFNIHQ